MWIRLLGNLFFYEPPAALIIFGNMVVLFFGAGFLVVNVLELLPPGDAAAGVMVALWAVGTIATDVWYRRSSGRSLLDLERSTVYGIVPSWLAGVALLFLSAWLLGRS